MPDYWQFPTVSMGLGPLMAIYQARFLKYLQGRGLADTAGRKVWAFLGDGEMRRAGEPGRDLARRRARSSTTWCSSINCNLQRLDGPVRGNGKIIQELEGDLPRRRLERRSRCSGARAGTSCSRATRPASCVKRMEEVVDGEYQDFKSKNGAYVREHFFGKYPELAAMVAELVRRRDLAPDPRRPRPVQGLRRLPRRPEPQGPADRDPRQDRQGLRHGRGRRGPEHHPSAEEDGRERTCGSSATASSSRSTDEQLEEDAVPQARRRTARSTRYLHERRKALGGYLPARRQKSAAARGAAALGLRRAARRRPTSARSRTTMAFVRILNTLLRDKKIGKHVVPIVPDESRTFGMEGMFRQFGIFSQVGQLYRPRGCQPADVLQGGQDRPDPAGGHQRGRRDVVLDRGGDLLQHATTCR